ncbi:MAG: hypothetical protein LBL57_07735 [Tannerella sp.]|nr:hypothetical protein [Tannerella sp.]
MDGQFIFTTDTRELFADVGNTRLQCVFPLPAQQSLTLLKGDEAYYYDGSQPVEIDLDATIRIILSKLDGIGSVSGEGWYRPGETCTISCTLQANSHFDGWYDEQFNLISGLRTYSFPAEKAMTLIARATLSPPPPEDGTTSEPTEPPTGTPENTAPTLSPEPTPEQGPTEEPTEAPTEDPTEEPTEEP